MKRPRFPLLASSLSLLLALAAPAGAVGPPYYARGDYRVGTVGAWGIEADNMLHDDGLHGDGAAGDGVYGAYVASDQPPGQYEFKIGNADWTDAHPTHPVYVLANPVLYTYAEGEVIHFRFDVNARGDGWSPERNAVACDHFAPPGTAFELMGSAPELGNWVAPVPTVDVGGVWTTVVGIAGAGDYEYKFRAAGTWDVCNIGVHYNMFVGDNLRFTLDQADQWVRFEFDSRDGRCRAQAFDPTPSRPTTFGRLKGRYR